MKKIIRFFIIVFSVIFVLFLRDSLINEALGELAEVSSHSHYYVLFLFITTFSYVCFIRNISKVKTIYPIPILEYLIIIIFVVSFFWSLFKPFPSIAIYIRIILPVFTLVFSHSVIQRIDNLRLCYALFVTMLIVLLIVYFTNYQNILYLQGEEQTVTNSSYYLLYLLPLFLCIDKKYIIYCSAIAITIAVLMSAKRGGAIAIICGLLSYIIVNKVFLKSNKHRIIKIFFISIVIVFLFYLALGNISSGDYYIVDRMMDISNSGGSGRNVVWKRTNEMILGSPLLNFFIGHGFNAVVNDSPIHLSAHNDFLEIIYDFGLPVFILYIIFHYQFIRRIIVMINQGSAYAAPLACSYMIFFITSMVAHIFIYSHYLTICCFVWGIILGLYNREQRSLISDKL